MITIFCGPLGGGKNIMTMQFMEEAARSGRPMYTNIELLPKCPFFRRTARIDDPKGKWPVVRGVPDEANYFCFWDYIQKNSIVVIDEADLYFWCRENSKFGRDIFEFHKWSRKYDIDLIYVVQRVGNLALSIRSLANRFIYCEYNFRTAHIFQTLGQNWSRFFRYEFPTSKLNMAEVTRESHMSYREASRFFGWYRTKQVVGVDRFCKGSGVKK